jgi:hypothetical protein
MKNNKFKQIISIILGSILVTAGCSKGSSSSSAPLAAARVPDEIHKAFDKSPVEVKQAATDYVAAFQEKDSAVAFAGLQRLSTRADLTPEQRSVTARAMATTYQQLRAAAQAGNQSAKAAMQQYISSR